MKPAITILFFIAGVIISGCLSNPMKEVPIINVKITFEEKQGIAEAVNYTFTQGAVPYLNRPKAVRAESFPAIAARTGSNNSIGPWENVKYNGSGTYSFNLGFDEKYYPVSNDTIHISIIVLDKDGERIGYVVENMKWK